jgi:hypothetical protein
MYETIFCILLCVQFPKFKSKFCLFKFPSPVHYQIYQLDRCMVMTPRKGSICLPKWKKASSSVGTPLVSPCFQWSVNLNRAIIPSFTWTFFSFSPLVVISFVVIYSLRKNFFWCSAANLGKRRTIGLKAHIFMEKNVPKCVQIKDL